MTFLFISFIAGVLTVLAPCVLPVLPVIIGGSVSDGANKRKSYVIIASLVISVVVFTLVLKWSTAFIMVPAYVWQYISGGILILVALSMIFPALWENIPFLAQLGTGSNKILGDGYKKKNIWGDIIIGAALGPVFSSCSPTYFVILATVLPQSFGKGLVDLFAYAAGLGLVLLLIAFLGQRLVSRLEGATNPRGWLKRSVGILFLLVGIFIVSGLDKSIETKLTAGGYFDITGVEQKLLQANDGTGITNDVVSGTPSQALSLAEKAAKYPKYTEIADPSAFVNTGGLPITIGQYVGKKVILIDFLAYSCINCQRTFPYLNTWYSKYEDKGLVIIGIHTPEFAFEHVQKNVEAAMQQFGIKFPVVLDNDYGTWNAYGNQYWPRKYLIDIDGYVVYDHIGEGEYDHTEAKIVDLLNERAVRLGEPAVSAEAAASDEPHIPVTTEDIGKQSPETYFGTARDQYEHTGTGALAKDEFSLSGTWDRQPEYIQLTSDTGTISYRFYADKVHLVAEAPLGDDATVLLDGKPISNDLAGEDVNNAAVTFGTARLYTLVDLKATPGEHTIEIQVHKKGLKAYTFTFS